MENLNHNQTVLRESKTNSQLIKHLQSNHGLIIEDPDDGLKKLDYVGYYRLSGYGVGLYQKENSELFRPDVTFNHLYNLYEFDSKFKSLLFYAIEQIEIELRALISNHLGITYGPDCYLNPDFFENTEKTIYVDGKEKKVSIHKSIIDSFRNEVKRQKRKPFIKHHIDNYDGQFPIWVAVELFTLGNLTSLFVILKSPDKQAIADYYGIKYENLKSWLLSFSEVRNICAHSGRIYNMPLKQSPKLFREHNKYQNSRIHKIFPVLLALKGCMKNRPQDWNYFIHQLTILFEKYKNNINLSFIGFPKNWMEVLKSEN